jgi:hypothetical protein
VEEGLNPFNIMFSACIDEDYSQILLGEVIVAYGAGVFSKASAATWTFK